MKKHGRLLAGITAGICALILLVFGIQKLTGNRGADSVWQNACWIWADCEKGENEWADFRRDFVLEEKPDSAVVSIACDSKYWMYVNGNLVVLDGGLTRGPDETNTYYDEVDIAPFLQEGENSLCLLVWYWGSTGETTHYITSGAPGLIVSTTLMEHGEAVNTGDGNWYARKDAAYQSSGERPNRYLGEYAEVYDAAKGDNWITAAYNPADEGWEKAVKQGHAGDAPWNTLVKRPTSLIKDYGITWLSLEDADVSDTSDGGTLYTFRLPSNIQYSPCWKLGAATEEGKECRAYSETKDMSGLDMTYLTRIGEQVYNSKTWISGDMLYFSIPEGVEVVSLGYRQSGYAISKGEDSAFAGSFSGTTREENDTFYDTLWQKAANTLYVCMRDGYMDCPDRERGQYIGDVLWEMEESFYCMGPEADALSAKAIREICAGQIAYEVDGETLYAMSSIEPIASVHEIPVQELAAAEAAWEYYLYTGDESVPRDCFNALYNYLTNYSFEKHGDYKGTIRMRKESELYPTYNLKNSKLSQWTDWGKNQDTRVSINCWWYLAAKALRSMANLESVQATDEQIAYLEENMNAVEENFEKFWNEELHAYASTWDDAWYQREEMEDGTHLVDDRVNAMAVLTGLADESHYEDIRDVFMGTDSTPAYENAGIWMEKAVLEALYRMGYADDAMTRMKSRYEEIVADDTSSTLPEAWPDTSIYVNGSSTKNHGWSGGPLYVLSRYAAGIEPTEAGYASWRVRPQTGAFTEIAEVVPSAIGSIRMEITTGQSSLQMSVTSPGGEAEIWVPASSEDTVTSENDAAVFQTMQEAFGISYAVYTTQQDGTYSFIVQMGE